MTGRKLAADWPLIAMAIALVGFAFVIATRTGGTPAQQAAAPEPTRISRALAAGTQPTPAGAAPTPTLGETLRAADALVRAGVMAPPPPPPPLIDVLHAADELVRAGVLAPPPPALIDVLRASAMLDGRPDPAPPAPTPPLIDVLRAAAILNGQPDPAPPPPAPPAPPPPPAAAAVAQPTIPPPPPTSTPVPTAPPPPVPPTKTPATKPAAGGWYDEAFTGQVFVLVNERRTAAGLQPVVSEPRLTNAAATYAKVLADNNWFSHTGPDGSTLVTRDEAAGFPFDVQIGEVLAWGSNNWQPAQIVQAWMDSPGHREQLISPVYTRAGASCYFTQQGTVMVRCVMEFAG